jgi:hypothetical protein
MRTPVTDAFKLPHPYNFVQGRSTLDGKTPAGCAGINLNLGKNKIVGLFRQSRANPTGDSHVPNL